MQTSDINERNIQEKISRIKHEGKTTALATFTKKGKRYIKSFYEIIVKPILLFKNLNDKIKCLKIYLHVMCVFPTIPKP
jgi:hypothetical protein